VPDKQGIDKISTIVTHGAQKRRGDGDKYFLNKANIFQNGKLNKNHVKYY
jgi:hypothetical protein